MFLTLLVYTLYKQYSKQNNVPQLEGGSKGGSLKTSLPDIAALKGQHKVKIISENAALDRGSNVLPPSTAENNAKSVTSKMDTDNAEKVILKTYTIYHMWECLKGWSTLSVSIPMQIEQGSSISYGNTYGIFGMKSLTDGDSDDKAHHSHTDFEGRTFS